MAKEADKVDKVEAKAPNISDDVLAEIEGAVEVAGMAADAERKAREPIPDPGKEEFPPEEDTPIESAPAKELPPTKDPAPDVGEEKKGKDPIVKTDDEIADTLIERAVKAGLGIADARSFKTANALENVCATLEKRTVPAKDEGGETQEEPEDADSLLAAIPDLEPEDYDEKVVAGFKAMKSLIAAQQNVIKGMKNDGKSRDASWFDGQIAALGVDYVEAVGTGDRSKLVAGSPQAEKLGELENKFSVLSAGYKAAGQDVEQKAVFNEAVQLVMGDVTAGAAEAKKRDALAKRSKLHISRPSGADIKPKTDALADAADALDVKYFGKK